MKRSCYAGRKGDNSKGDMLAESTAPNLDNHFFNGKQKVYRTIRSKLTLGVKCTLEEPQYMVPQPWASHALRISLRIRIRKYTEGAAIHDCKTLGEPHTQNAS